MEQTYAELKSRWLEGKRDRELALRLMFFAWMHWAEPPFVTGMTDDPEAAHFWHEAFACLNGEFSMDVEVLYVSGLMAALFPWVLGDEAEWEKRAARMQARAKEIAPTGIPPALFENRGAYGDYFADQLRGGSRQT